MTNEMDALRRTVAGVMGENPETWPEHGNAALAIATLVALRCGRVISPLIEEEINRQVAEERKRLKELMAGFHEALAERNRLNDELRRMVEKIQQC